MWSLLPVLLTEGLRSRDEFTQIQDALTAHAIATEEEEQAWRTRPPRPLDDPSDEAKAAEEVAWPSLSPGSEWGRLLREGQEECSIPYEQALALNFAHGSLCAHEGQQ